MSLAFISSYSHENVQPIPFLFWCVSVKENIGSANDVSNMMDTLRLKDKHG